MQHNILEKVLNLIPNVESEETITQLIDNVSDRLKLRLGGYAEVPQELEWIVIDVVVKRFNMIGSEGTTRHTVEGESMEWISTNSKNGDEFGAYFDDIERYLKQHTSAGKVRFI